MGSKHFKQLDDEALAQHDSWDAVLRVVLLVAVVAVLVWATCTALRFLVHHALDLLFESTQRKSATGVATIAAVLLAGGIFRSLLFVRPGWSSVRGDGMDEALANYHITYDYEGDDPQPRYARPAFSLAARKFAATFLTLGTGASGGLEAPVVMISECLSAGMARVLGVASEYELRTYQLAGISAAVATLLGAPFSAALFATEIAYGDRIIYRKLAYALWAGMIAYLLNNWLHGAYVPLFVAPKHSVDYSLSELGGAALVAVTVSVPVAVSFGQAMTHISRQLDRRIVAGWHPVVSSAGIALVALLLFHVAGIAPRHLLGMGEETVSELLSGDSSLQGGLLLLVLLGKTLTTGLTVAGGGSAGLLIPSMFLGGVSGAWVAQTLNFLGVGPLDPALFTVVGIGSSLVAVVGVPLCAIALVFEVFGKAFGPPSIIACGATYLLTLKLHIYKNQRASPDPEGDETGSDRSPSVVQQTSSDSARQQSSRDRR